MKILHLASFSGNLGDIASHLGFDNVLKQLTLKEPEVTRLEIRRFYDNYTANDRLSFDLDFISEANKYDLVIVGGGAFLEPDRNGSVSGCTLNLDPRSITKIKPKLIFTSIGCIKRGSPPNPKNLNKLKSLIEAVAQKEENLIALRNDGSVKALKDYIGLETSYNIRPVLDNAFFFNPKLEIINEHKYLEKPYVAINITADQLEASGIDEYLYYQNLKEFIIGSVLEKNLDIFFIPHVVKDLEAIYKVLKTLPEEVRRLNIHISPIVNTVPGLKESLKIYSQAELILTSRFHAAVCNISMGNKTFCLNILNRVKYLCESLSSEELLIDPLVSISKQISDNQKYYSKPQLVLDSLRQKTLNIYEERLC